MRMRHAQLREAWEGKALVVEVRPAAPARSHLAMLALLGLLFGLPALGVALDGARRDAWSLGAMALGLGVAAGAAGLAWQAIAARRVRLVRLEPESLGVAGRSWPWRQVTGVEVRRATPATAPAALPHRLGAAIADRHLATGATVVLQLGGTGGAPSAVTLAGGLDPETAERLRAVILGYGPPGELPGTSLRGPAAGEG